MSTDANTIKSITPHFCPHCRQEIFVKLHTIPTTLAGVLSREDINKAKERVVEALKKKMAPEAHALIVPEIMDPNVMFGPDEVESIIEQYQV